MLALCCKRSNRTATAHVGTEARLQATTASQSNEARPRMPSVDVGTEARLPERTRSRSTSSVVFRCTLQAPNHVPSKGYFEFANSMADSLVASHALSSDSFSAKLAQKIAKSQLAFWLVAVRRERGTKTMLPCEMADNIVQFLQNCDNIGHSAAAMKAITVAATAQLRLALETELDWIAREFVLKNVQPLALMGSNAMPDSVHIPPKSFEVISAFTPEVCRGQQPIHLLISKFKELGYKIEKTFEYSSNHYIALSWD